MREIQSSWLLTYWVGWVKSCKQVIILFTHKFTKPKVGLKIIIFLEFSFPALNLNKFLHKTKQFYGKIRQKSRLSKMCTLLIIMKCQKNWAVKSNSEQNCCNTRRTMKSKVLSNSALTTWWTLKMLNRLMHWYRFLMRKEWMVSKTIFIYLNTHYVLRATL